MGVYRTLLRTGTIVLFITMALFCTLGAAYLYLPFWIETRIIEHISSDMGLPLNLRVRTVAWDHTDLVDLSWGDPDHPAISIATLQIDYTLAGLIQRRIDGIRIQGVRLGVHEEQTHWKVTGFEPQERMPALKSDDNDADPPGPISIERVLIEDLHLTVAWRDQHWLVPLSAVFNAVDGNPLHWDYGLELYPWGRRVNVGGRADLNRATLSVAFDLARADLENLATLMPALIEGGVSGQLAAQGNLTATLEPFQLQSVVADISLERLHVAAGSLEVGSMIDNRGLTVPWQWHIRKKKETPWQLEASALSVTSPLAMTISSIDATLDTASGLEAAGSARVDFGALSSAPAKRRSGLTTPLETRLSVAATLKDPHQWHGTLKLAPLGRAQKEPASFDGQLFGWNLKGRDPELRMTASGQAGAGRMEIALTANELSAEAAELQLSTAGVLLDADVRWKDWPSLLTSPLAYAFTSSRLQIESGSRKVAVNQTTLNGELRLTPGLGLEAQGELTLDKASVDDTAFPVSADGIHIHIPFVWPPGQPSPAQGNVTVDNLSLEDKEMGRLTASVRQDPDGFVLQGELAVLPIKGLAFDILGKALPWSPRGFDGRVELTLPRFELGSHTNLQHLLPNIQGLRLDGQLSSRAQANYSENALATALDVHLRNGRLDLEDDRLAIAGIETNVHFTDVVNFQSAPHQRLKFATARFGNLAIENAFVDFTLESADTLFLENSRFKWCGGGVHIPAMRMVKGEDRYKAVLHCDRINLAKLLAQFGIANMEGGGAVNGKIPMEYSRGRLRIDNGFLYSTPGQGGKLRLTGTDILLAGVPEGSREYNQILLAVEALKNYDYRWIKLDMNTTGDMLMLRMQMDGKPAAVLPFNVDPTTGAFVRPAPGKPGSIFQGISLDVNFRLPVDQLIRHGKTLSEILNTKP